MGIYIGVSLTVLFNHFKSHLFPNSFLFTAIQLYYYSI